MQDEKITIVDFKPEHFARLRLRREDAADLAGLDTAGFIEHWADGRTILRGDEVVFIYGFSLDSGTANIWALTSALLETMPLFITKLAKEGIKSLFRLGAHRIESYCHVDNVRSLAWHTRCLGFQVEGLLRKSGPNRQDRFILSIVKESYL